MRGPSRKRYFPAIFAIAGALAPSACAQNEAHAAPPVASAPVVVELFTSEGCSSCPPADRVLADLEAKNPGGVIPLAFHVDYWDGIGWKDPFSSASWTERQQAYSRAQGRSNVYTPEMVVDGREEFVGSDASHAESAIASAAKKPKTAVAIAITQSGGARSLTVKIGATISAEPADVLLALTDAHASIDVKSGENAGRRLEHTAIVRSLRVVGTASATGCTFSIPIDANTGPERAVVFVQEKRSRAISGAATVTL